MLIILYASRVQALCRLKCRGIAPLLSSSSAGISDLGFAEAFFIEPFFSWLLPWTSCLRTALGIGDSGVRRCAWRFMSGLKQVHVWHTYSYKQIT